jgi:hypothetical protein
MERSRSGFSRELYNWFTSIAYRILSIFANYYFRADDKMHKKPVEYPLFLLGSSALNHGRDFESKSKPEMLRHDQKTGQNIGFGP